MSKALGIVGKVAGIVATVAAFTPGGQGVAAIAGAVSAIANVGAAVTAQKPPARGSVNGITIGTDQPSPYLIGRTYYGGSRQQQVGYGPTVDKVPNPYALIVDIHSVAGPIQGYEGFYTDFVNVPVNGGAATGYAANFLWIASQRGLVPEATALVPHFAGAPGWGPAYGLSGEAATAWSLRFDKNGKVFASGVPQLGAIARGVLTYDPRKDSTYPGGAGSHRVTDEATWEWSENPGLHALTYAYGRYQRGVKVFGVGMPLDGLIVDHFVHLANVCDANRWTVGGVIFEPGSKWNNLKDILAAGGAEPCWFGGKLGLRISAPRIALDTITVVDLADGEVVVGAMQGWEDRLNTLIPKYRSEPHKWEYVQSSPVSVAQYVIEDGEAKQEERQMNLVQDKDQAAQLCAYELLDRRELGEIEIRCKPRLRRYGGGDLLIVDIPEAGLIAQPCVVLKRTLDPGDMTVSFVLRGETTAKHAFALGQNGVAPPTPAIRTTEDLDGSAAAITFVARPEIATSFPIGLNVMATADGTITINDHVRRYTDGHADVTVTGTTIASGLAAGSYAAIGYDDPERLGGAVAYLTLDDDIDARVSPDHPGRHYVGYVFIPETGSSGGGGATPPGGSGGCPVPSARVLLANAAQSGPGDTIRMGDLEPGMWVWSPHEHTGEWRAWRVSNTWRFISPIWALNGRPDTSPSHLWSVDPLSSSAGWQRMDTMGRSIGRGDVIGVTVAEAHTYVLVADDGSWLLSHNKIAQQNDA